MRKHHEREEIFGHDLSSFMKILSYLFIVAILIFSLFVMLSLFRISSYSFKTYDNIEDIPHHKVGLLLGTSPKESSGQPNDYFTYRILAAVELYNAHKIDYILVSGDNRHESYNEPRHMQRALIKSGVDPKHIVFDFAGISTLDSVIRANKVFLQQNFTIISQEFHNERALFIADNNGINAVGYNALTPDYGFFSKVAIRELFARIKCIMDVYFLNTQPHFLGDPITIGSAPMPKEISNKPRIRTSKIKRATDNAQTLKEILELEKLKLIAKKPTNSARYQLTLEQMSDSSKDLSTSHEDELLQAQFFAEEQNQALEDSKEVAAESLSNGDKTYIDPQKNPQENRPQNQRRARTDIKNFYGDPWDYW